MLAVWISWIEGLEGSKVAGQTLGYQTSPPLISMPGSSEELLQKIASNSLTARHMGTALDLLHAFLRIWGWW
jgi:hypothetical protein